MTATCLVLTETSVHHVEDVVALAVEHPGEPVRRLALEAYALRDGRLVVAFAADATFDDLLANLHDFYDVAPSPHTRVVAHFAVPTDDEQLPQELRGRRLTVHFDEVDLPLRRRERHSDFGNLLHDVANADEAPLPVLTAESGRRWAVDFASSTLTRLNGYGRCAEPPPLRGAEFLGEGFVLATTEGTERYRETSADD